MFQSVSKKERRNHPSVEVDAIISWPSLGITLDGRGDSCRYNASNGLLSTKGEINDPEVIPGDLCRYVDLMVDPRVVYVLEDPGHTTLFVSPSFQEVQKAVREIFRADSPYYRVEMFRLGDAVPTSGPNGCYVHADITPMGVVLPGFVFRTKRGIHKMWLVAGGEPQTSCVSCGVKYLSAAAKHWGLPDPATQIVPKDESAFDTVYDRYEINQEFFPKGLEVVYWTEKRWLDCKSLKNPKFVSCAKSATPGKFSMRALQKQLGIYSNNLKVFGDDSGPRYARIIQKRVYVNDRLEVSEDPGGSRLACAIRLNPADGSIVYSGGEKATYSDLQPDFLVPVSANWCPEQRGKL